MISDGNAQVVWQKRYEPFGGEEEQSGSIENTYQFTGKGYDSDADLYYFNARWYDKDVGRLVTPKPWAKADSSPRIHCGAASSIHKV